MCIIGIVLLHTHYHLPSTIHFFRRLGYIYVDVFMMLSGYGLYYSLCNSRSLKRYFIKRAIRILPAFYILSTIYLLFMMLNGLVLLTDILGVYTTMSYWSGQEMVFSWFAQSLVAFYAFSPLLAQLVKTTNRHWWLLVVSFLFVLPFILSPRLILAISRLPAFVAGMCLAKDIQNNGGIWLEKRKLWILFSALIGFAVLGIFRFKLQPWMISVLGREYRIIFLPSVFIVPSIAILFSYLHNLLQKTIIGRYLVGAVERMGTFTFEIYLFQSTFYLILFHYLPEDYQMSNLMWFIVMLIAFGGGYILWKIIIPIQELLKEKWIK